jgi:hypothetical protein
MQKRILLDGCSFTYGLGLKRTQTLEHWFNESGYDVINLSRPGKSNQAMALDIYSNIDQCDIVVAGWSFSSRWHMQYHDQDIDFLASRKQVELPHTLDSGVIEQSYQELHKSFYSLFDTGYWSKFSNMLIDNTAALVTKHGKIGVFFSWEPRATMCDLYYPHVMSSHRLPDGHLNADGTANLFNKLTTLIEQQ